MIKDQFYALQKFYLLVSQIGSYFGSEDSSSGLVIPTNADSLAGAIAGFFPDSYQVYGENFNQFVKEFCRSQENAGVDDFLAYIQPLAPEFALVGEGDFNPKSKEKGEFHLCLFLPASAIAGTNLLICFNRAET